MVEEIDRDIAAGTLYCSERFDEDRSDAYPGLLREAAGNANADWLERAIDFNGMMKSRESRRLKGGRVVMAAVPHTAAQTFAEGEFNRFYLRALCRFTLEKGGTELEIYRAKRVEHPRYDSESRIGRRINAEALLEDLRTSTSVETAMRLPAGPNSGLSAKLIEIQ